jgi:GT2 family glycosyltransferase
VKLRIIIVNYRSAGLTIACLRSLAPEVAAHPDWRVVVTDNLSPDDSLAQLSAAITQNHWNSWCDLCPLPKNGGFAYGNNQAIRPALAEPQPPDYVILLNPDTLVRPGALATLTDFMHQHPAIGIAGSRLEDPDGTPQHSAFRFPGVRSELESSWRLGPLTALLHRYVVAPPISPQACPTDWVAGACMIVRRQVFDSIGLLDEGYFMYFEEVDFCLRAARAGWPCWYLPQARVVHLVGQTSGVTNARRGPQRRPAYWFAARKRYFRQHHGPLPTLLADLAWTSGFAAFRLRQALLHTPSDDPPALLRDFIRYNLIPFVTRAP